MTLGSLNFFHYLSNSLYFSAIKDELQTKKKHLLTAPIYTAVATNKILFN